jgi:hypothetical protein
MGSKRSLLSLTLALAVGLVIGCARKEAPAKPGGEGVNTSAALPPPPPAKPSKPIVVRIGPNASDINPPTTVTLHKSQNEQVIWVLVEGAGHNCLQSTGELYIEFVDKDVFQDAVLVNGRYRVPCQGIVCQSGPFDSNATLGEHKYWQVIVSAGGQEDKADGMIKIDP